MRLSDYAGSSEGKKIRITAVVTNSFRGAMYVHTGENSFRVHHDGNFIPGEIVKIAGVLKNAASFEISADEIARLKTEEAEKEYRRIENSLVSSFDVSAPKILVNETTKAVSGDILKVAKKLLAAKILGRFVLLRFHHDADGISGAIAIRKTIPLRTYQQNSAVYSAKEAFRDLEILSHENRPLVILVDFGSNDASREGIDLLNAAGIESVLIDHHPPGKGLESVSLSLSVWKTGEKDPSSYCAGYLSAEVAECCGSESRKLAAIAAAGDKSGILPVGDEEKKYALVFDYLAAYSSYGNRLEFYIQVFQKKELCDSIWKQAEEKIESAVAPLMERLNEKSIHGCRVVLADVEGSFVKGEFPSRGKITTAVFERIGGKEPLVVVGKGEQTIILRANQAAVDAGIKSGEIARGVAEKLKGLVVGGGGHGKAAAIRVKKEFVKEVTEEVLREIGASLSR